MLPVVHRSRSVLSRWNLVALVVIGALVVAVPTMQTIATAVQEKKTEPQPVKAEAQAAEAQAAAESEPSFVEFLPQPSEAERKILEKLKEPMTLAYQATPLGDVVAYLTEKTGINIVLEDVALQEAGLSAETPISVMLNQVRLESGLRVMLRPHNLEFVVADDVLKITSDTVARDTMITRTYPVDDLCPNGEGFQELTNAIKQTVEPVSWGEVGGSGEVAAVKASGSLVIYQSYTVHGKILDLLRNLRAARNRPGRVAERSEYSTSDTPP